MQASITFIAPMMLVLTHSNGLYSAVGHDLRRRGMHHEIDSFHGARRAGPCREHRR